MANKPTGKLDESVSKDGKTNFGNVNDITGSIISSTFANVKQDMWDNIFGKKVEKERYKKTEYDNNGNVIGERDKYGNIMQPDEGIDAFL